MKSPYDLEWTWWPIGNGIIVTIKDGRGKPKK